MNKHQVCLHDEGKNSTEQAGGSWSLLGVIVLVYSRLELYYLKPIKADRQVKCCIYTLPLRWHWQLQWNPQIRRNKQLLLFYSAKAIAGVSDHVLYAICAAAAEQRSWEAFHPSCPSPGLGSSSHRHILLLLISTAHFEKWQKSHWCW